MLSGGSSSRNTPTTPTPSTPSSDIFASNNNLLNLFSNKLQTITNNNNNNAKSNGVESWQIVPGSINPYNQAFSWSMYMGDELIAFASGKYIVIYHGNQFVQLLDGHDYIITCVKWSKSHGRLAACSKGRIVIYSPNSSEVDEMKSTKYVNKKPSWKIEQVIKGDDHDFECLDWNVYGDRLIVGGKYTMIWQAKPLDNFVSRWELVWKYLNPTPIFLVAYSSDEKYFATVSKFDRLVKVWYRCLPTTNTTITATVLETVMNGEENNDQQQKEEEEEESYSYIYLSHPKSVSSISWRVKDIQQGDEFSANVLLTTCRDNVIRIWSETNETEDLSFYVCSIIERDTNAKVQWLNTAHEKSPNEVILHFLKKKRRVYYEGGHRDIFLNVDDEDTAKESVEKRMKTASSDTGLFESQTWLGTVSKDGTLMIDLLQGLADFPRRTPKSSMWIRMPNALKGFEDPLNVSMFYKTADDTNPDLGSTTPKILTIYVQSRNGMLSSWELNLTKGSRANLELCNVYTGHVGKINTIACHPTLPLVASLNFKNNHLITWHTRDTPYYCPRDILTNIQDYKLEETTNIDWYPLSPHLICCNTKGIEIFQIRSANPLTHNLSSIYESTIFPPLPSYYEIHSCNIILENSEEFYSAKFLKVIPFYRFNENIVNNVVNETEKTSTIVVNDVGEKIQLFGGYVIAVSMDGRKVGVWKLENAKTENSVVPFQSTLILKESIPISKGNVTSVACGKSMPYLYDFQTTNEVVKKYTKKQSIVLVVGKSDGDVEVFKIKIKDTTSQQKEAPKPKIGGLLGKYTMSGSSSSNSSSTSSNNNQEDKIIIEKWLKFTAENSAVCHIECSDFLSRIATSTEKGDKVHIFEIESHPNYTIEQTIDLSKNVTESISPSEHVTKLQWMTYGDGQSILCIGTNQTIYCYTQSKISPKFDKNSVEEKYWKLFDILKPSIQHKCSSISITKERTIVAAFGSALHVYTKLLYDEDPSNLMLSSQYNMKGPQTLLSQSLLLHSRLPDYHPNFLIDLLMEGRFEIVKKIVKHVAKHLKAYDEKVTSKREDKFEKYLNPDGDYSDLLDIPTLKIESIMILEEEKKISTSATVGNQPQKRRTLLDKFTSPPPVEEEKKEVKKEEKIEEEDDDEEMSVSEAISLIKSLIAGVHLPGLSGSDQMNLLAVLDTFNEIQTNPGALDSSGIKFLVVMKYLQFLSRKKAHALEKLQNDQSQQPLDDSLLINKIKSSMIAWATHSETQDTLFDMICPEDVKISWKLLKQLGVVYWLRNINSLKKIAERLAKQMFKETNDPTQCAAYYLALKKKGALAQLFRLKNSDKVADLISKDFNDPRNKQVASKNAFVLISRQQFSYAAAYFLLADSPKDAIDILVKNEKDVDLAYFITRLYCGDDNDQCLKLLREILLPYYAKEKDIWMQSLIKWILKEYEESVELLIKRVDEDDNTIDPTLFNYCTMLDSKIQLNNSDVVAKNVLPVLLRTVHYYQHIGVPTLSLEYLRKLKNIDKYTQKKKLNASSTSQNSLMSGQLSGFGGFGMGMGMMGNNNNNMLMSGTFGGFGGGFGGGMGGNNNGMLNTGTFGGGFGMGGFGGMGMTPTNNQTTTLQTPQDDEYKEQTEITDLIRFKIALSILSQELYNISKQQNLNSHSDWEKNHKKLMTEIDDIVSKFDVDRNMILKKLKNFTKINSLLTARCLLCTTPESIVRVIESFTYQIITTLSLLIKQSLNEVQIANIERLLKEYIYCYNRLRHAKVKITEKQQADMSSTYFIMQFIILYSKRDFDALFILLTLHQSFDKQNDTRDSISSNTTNYYENKVIFDKFYHLLFDRMNVFYNKFNKALVDFKVNQAIQAELDQEEKQKKKLVQASKMKTISAKDVEKKREHYIKLLQDYHSKGKKVDTNSNKSDELEKLETDFHWEMFDAFLIFKFTTTLKDFIEKAYDETYSSFVKQSQKKKEDLKAQNYSLGAQTAISCTSLWCSFLERRLQYKEMEIYTMSENHPSPSFKEVNSLSVRTHLSNLVETLSHGIQKKHGSSQSQGDVHFHSLAHALPELGLDQSVAQHNLFLSCIGEHWLADEKIFDTFKSNTSCQKLWNFLLDTKTSPTISSSISVNNGLSKMVQSGSDSQLENKVSNSSNPMVRSNSNLEDILKFNNGSSSNNNNGNNSQIDEPVRFSADIEIVKSKEAIRSFCVDSNNPTYLAFAAGKCIREINIEHSIRYRKRNPSLDKLLDEEAATWEQSLHRFDDIASKDVNTNKVVQQTSLAKVPSISNFNVFDFLETVNDDEAATNKNLKKFIGFSNPMSRSSMNNNSSYMNKLKVRFAIGKRPSFTTNSPSASHFKQSSSSSKLTSPSSGTKKSGKIDRNQSTNVLISHPFLPFYLSGGTDGAVYMWQYGFQYALRTYREAGTPLITSIHFSRFGYKFGVTDASGYLTLWRFEASKESLHYFYHLYCHSVKTNDFSFLESGSLVATIGLSKNVGELCIWDLFSPNQEAKTFSHTFGGGDEPLSVRYSYKYKVIIVGTRKGDIYLFDAQDGNYKFLVKLSSPHTCIQVLNIDVTEDFFVTGCSDGHVCVWDMKTLKQLYYYQEAHSKRKLFEQSGVTWSEISTRFFYSSGADGRIIRKTIV
ncbi:hypothetical protein ABK040_003737 [Willaertia magna]